MYVYFLKDLVEVRFVTTVCMYRQVCHRHEQVLKTCLRKLNSMDLMCKFVTVAS